MRSKQTLAFLERTPGREDRESAARHGPDAWFSRAFSKNEVKIRGAMPIKISMDANLFGDYEKLLRVEVLGRPMEMPENNTLLRGLQFAVPQTISYGRFCWNGSCNNCSVTVRNGECESKALACRMDTCDGMHVTSASPEIKRLL